MNKQVKRWITVNGKHVPIYEENGVEVTGGFYGQDKPLAPKSNYKTESKFDKYEDDEHHPTAIADVKKGDFFKLSNKPNAKVYVRDEYDRSEKAYWCYDFYDVNDGRYIKKNKTVYTGFTF